MKDSGRSADDTNVLVVDVEKNAALAINAPELSVMTERHAINLLKGRELEPVANAVAAMTAFTGGDIIVMIVTTGGLPGHALLSAAGKQANIGKRVYFYWPREHAVEVVDHHRLKSYWRHWMFAVAAFKFLWVLRTSKTLVLETDKRVRDMAHAWQVATIVSGVSAKHHDLRTAEVARTPVPAEAAIKKMRLGAAALFECEHLDEDNLPGASSKIAGAGGYVRLDYWSKLKTGGSYGHTCFLANSAAKMSKNFECVFANKYELLDWLGVRQTLLGHNSPARTSTDLIYYGNQFKDRLCAALNKLKPAYVYERSVLGNAAAAEWCDKHNVPYIVEYNGSELAMARTFGQPYELETELEKLEDYQFAVASVVNVISEPVADSLVARGIPREKILVNPNAVNPDVYKPLLADEMARSRAKYNLVADDVIVGFCGTFGGWHGIEVLAASLPAICAINPQIKFLLIGDGNLKPLVRDAIERNNLQNQVIDLGLIPQLEGAQAMATCDILVAPHAQNIDGKTFFGSPTKLFEYLAVGAAVVSSDLAQLGEIMRPALSLGDLAAAKAVTDERGVLVSPGSVEELVEAVAALARSPDIRRELAKNARAAVLENYTWDNHVRNIWRFLAGIPLKGYVNDRVKSA